MDLDSGTPTRAPTQKYSVLCTSLLLVDRELRLMDFDFPCCHNTSCRIRCSTAWMQARKRGTDKRDPGKSTSWDDTWDAFGKSTSQAERIQNGRKKVHSQHFGKILNFMLYERKIQERTKRQVLSDSHSVLGRPQRKERV